MVKSKEEPTSDDGIGYNQMPPNDIFAYNELRSCLHLFDLHKNKTLDIQPEFQRNEVWPVAYQTRFIDSLLKEMPIPSMCISYDKNRSEMRVIDGLQRMVSIIKFLDLKKEWKLSKLPEIDPRISGKTNIQIQKENKVIFDNIQNLSLPITFLRVHHGNRDHDEYLFEIFHRLNTYGKKLNFQEIRNCIFSGPFNTLIKEANKDSNWKSVLNFTRDARFLKVELVLRFFAFYDEGKKYNGNLTRFLNDFMSMHRSDDENDNAARQMLFKDTVGLIFEKISDRTSLSRRPSNAFVDALLFGVAKNLTYLENLDSRIVKGYYKKLISDEDFTGEELLESTMRREKVTRRLEKSRLIFSGN